MKITKFSKKSLFILCASLLVIICGSVLLVSGGSGETISEDLSNENTSFWNYDFNNRSLLNYSYPNNTLLINGSLNGEDAPAAGPGFIEGEIMMNTSDYSLNFSEGVTTTVWINLTNTSDSLSGENESHIDLTLTNSTETGEHASCDVVLESSGQYVLEVDNETEGSYERENLTTGNGTLNLFYNSSAGLLTCSLGSKTVNTSSSLAGNGTVMIGGALTYFNDSSNTPETGYGNIIVYFNTFEMNATTIGNTPPNSTIHSVDGKTTTSNYTNNQTLAINFTASDSNIDYWNISVYNSTSDLINSSQGSSNNTASETTLGVSEDGTFTINLTVEDSFNNTVISSFDMTVDTSDPTAPNITAPSDQIINQDTVQIHLSDNSTDTNFKTYQVYSVNSSSWADTTSDNSTGFNFILSQDSNNTLYIRGKDYAGNTGSNDSTWVLEDSTVPSINISEPINTTYSNSAGNRTVNFTINEPRIEIVNISIDGKRNYTPNSNGSHEYKNFTGLLGGTHQATFFANDSASNSNTITVNFKMNRTLNATNTTQGLNTSLGAKDVNIKVNGTDESDDGSLDLNTNLSLEIKLNASGSNATAEITEFNGMNANWEQTFNVNTNSSSSVADNTNSSSGKSVTKMTSFNNTENFLGSDEFTKGAKITFEANISNLDALFIEDDAGQNVTELPKCSGNNPVIATNISEACYTSNSPTVTLHVPHFSGGAVVNDTTPPTIENVSNTSIDTTSATITWDTNEYSNSTVNYGTSNDSLDEETASSSRPTQYKHHTVSLTSLFTDTTYYYNVTSCDDGKCNSSSIYSFTTDTVTDNTSPSGSPTTTTTNDTGVSQTHIWGTIQSGQTVTLEITKDEIGLDDIEITASNGITNGQLKVTELHNKGSASEESPGTTYQYFTIEDTGMSSSDYSNVSITLKVEKSWINNNNIDENKVYLYKWSNDEWNKIETTLKTKGSTYYKYKSLTSGFSTFSIAGKEEVSTEDTGDQEVDTGNETTGNETTNITTTGEEEGEGIFDWKLVVSIVVLIAVIVIVGLHYYYNLL